MLVLNDVEIFQVTSVVQVSNITLKIKYTMPHMIIYASICN